MIGLMRIVKLRFLSKLKRLKLRKLKLLSWNLLIVIVEARC